MSKEFEKKPELQKNIVSMEKEIIERVKQLRSMGWVQADFAKALKELLENKG